MKCCSKCKINKPKSEFGKDKSKSDSLRSQCKSCDAAYYKANKERYAEQSATYYISNKERLREQKRVYDATYYVANKIDIIEWNKDYYVANRERLIKQNIDYIRNRRKTDAEFKLLRNLRNRTNQAVKAAKTEKSAGTLKLLGCTPAELKNHIESKFTEGMSWENQGAWHIDHIRPCAAFDLRDPQQQKECFHYTNLQPLWAIDNLKKSDKY